MLVDAVVKVTLDRSTICIRGQDESPPRGTELLELHTQSVELPLHVEGSLDRRIATLMLAAAAVVGVVPSAAQDPPAPIAAESLTPRSVFADAIHMKLRLKDDGGETAVVQVDDPSRTVVVRYTVQPGAQFPGTATPAPCS